MQTLPAALRRIISQRGMTDSQVLVASFLIIGGLMLLGVIALRTLDYFRNRVNKFQPLFDPGLENWQRLGLLASLQVAFVMGMFIGFAVDPGWGAVTFLLASINIFVSDRFTLDRQRRLAAMICGEVACAIRYNLPLDQFFETMAAEHHSKNIQKIAARLRAGMKLSDAFAESNFFPVEGIVAIRAAEGNGGAALESVLQYLSVQIGRDQQAWSPILNQVYTPLLGWSFAFLIGYWTCSLVLIRVLECARTIGQARAICTFMSVALKYLRYSGPVAVALFGMSLLFIAFHPEVRRIFADLREQLAARLPFFGARMRHRVLARTCETLGSLLANDVPIWKALHTVSNRNIAGVYAEELQRIGLELENGGNIEAVLHSSTLPDSVKSLATAGARSGTLAAAFAAAAEWHDSHARKLDRILFTIVPCITIPLCGSVIGLIYGTTFFLLTAIREGASGGLVH